MSNTFIAGGISLLLFLGSASGCEKTDDPCDREGNNYSPLKCALGIDDRPVCKEDDPPWRDCRKTVYTARELGLTLGIEAREADRLLESAGYPPEEPGGSELKYWLDEEALDSLAQLSDP